MNTPEKQKDGRIKLNQRIGCLGTKLINKPLASLLKEKNRIKIANVVNGKGNMMVEKIQFIFREREYYITILKEIQESVSYQT